MHRRRPPGVQSNNSESRSISRSTCCKGLRACTLVLGLRVQASFIGNSGSNLDPKLTGFNVTELLKHSSGAQMLRLPSMWAESCEIKLKIHYYLFCVDRSDWGVGNFSMNPNGVPITLMIKFERTERVETLMHWKCDIETQSSSSSNFKEGGI